MNSLLDIANYEDQCDNNASVASLRIV